MGRLAPMRAERRMKSVGCCSRALPRAPGPPLEDLLTFRALLPSRSLPCPRSEASPISFHDCCRKILLASEQIPEVSGAQLPLYPPRTSTVGPKAVRQLETQLRRVAGSRSGAA